jgi:heme/copper-type cytochrome/quinol oxidase subunit 2
MKKMIRICRYLQLRLFVLLSFLFLAGSVTGQTPTHYPTGKDPVQLDLVNILLFIVFPVLLVVLWIVIRQRARKSEKKEKGKE